jgi:uncharacterized repeat protein (TIGR01451 family)
MRKRKGGGGVFSKRIFCLPPYEGRNMSTNTTGRRFPVWAMVLLGAAFALVAVVLASFAGGTTRARVGPDHLAADLHTTKAVNPKSVKVGQTQTFVIKVTNQRGDTARGVVMTDPLPRVVNFVRASTSRHDPGSCRKSGHTVTCDLGNLKVGGLVKVKIFVKPTKAVRYVNRAYVEHSTAELQSVDNIDGARARAT